MGLPRPFSKVFAVAIRVFKRRKSDLDFFFVQVRAGVSIDRMIAFDDHHDIACLARHSVGCDFDSSYAGRGQMPKGSAPFESG